MDAFIEFCQSWTMGGIAARLFLATLAGVIIGMDREYKNKGAGIKTHALVCIGAALSMIVNEFIFRTFPSSNTDLARMGAQVISGIGFLGVGTIIVTGRNEVKGLTTAAGSGSVPASALPQALVLSKARFWPFSLSSSSFGCWSPWTRNSAPGPGNSTFTLNSKTWHPFIR